MSYMDSNLFPVCDRLLCNDQPIPIRTTQTVNAYSSQKPDLKFQEVKS